MLHLKIITPKKIVLEKEISLITVPSDQGEITILPHHANLFCLLKEGVVKIKEKKGEEFLAIGGGYLETDGQEVNLLVSRAYGQEEIDQDLIVRAMDDAKKLLIEAKDGQQKLEAASLLRKYMVDFKLLKKKKAPRSFSENV